MKPTPGGLSFETVGVFMAEDTVSVLLPLKPHVVGYNGIRYFRELSSRELSKAENGLISGDKDS